MKEAIIIGYSGHSMVVIETLHQNKFVVTGYCEKSEKSYNPYNLQYLGAEDTLGDFIFGKSIFIAIGDNSLREKVYNKILNKKLNTPYVFHPSSCVSATAEIGLATVVMPGSIINAFSKIGVGVICNSASIIEHECIISDFSHIAPGAVLAGGVQIGKNSFIGANAVIKQGVKVGSNVVVGAGSVILKDVKDNTIVYGNPSKVK